eukprot:747490-Hanusia_phi.AAC.3
MQREQRAYPRLLPQHLGDLSRLCTPQTPSAPRQGGTLPSWAGSGCRGSGVGASGREGEGGASLDSMLDAPRLTRRMRET